MKTIKLKVYKKTIYQFILHDAEVSLAEKLGISEKIIYISFGFEVVKTIKRLQPNAIVLYLENNNTPDLQ